MKTRLPSYLMFFASIGISLVLLFGTDHPKYEIEGMAIFILFMPPFILAAFSIFVAELRFPDRNIGYSILPSYFAAMVVVALSVVWANTDYCSILMQPILYLVLGLGCYFASMLFSIFIQLKSFHKSGIKIQKSPLTSASSQRATRAADACRSLKK